MECGGEADVDRRASRRAASAAEFAGPLDLVIGPQVRFLLGAALLALNLLWMNQNGMLSQQAAQDLQTGNLGELAEGTRPLDLPIVPASLEGAFLNGWGVGLAGVVLLISAFFRGTLLSLSVLLAAGMLVGGHQVGYGDRGPVVGRYVVGIAIALIAFIFFQARTRRDDE
jgi:hypothetical protein